MGIMVSIYTYFVPVKDTKVEDYYLHAWELDDMTHYDEEYKKRHHVQEPIDFMWVPPNTPNREIPTYR